jgi:WD40 repeat protein
MGGAIVAAVLFGVGLSAFFNRSPAPGQQAAAYSPPSAPAGPSYTGPPPITIQPLTGGAFQSKTPANPDAVPVVRTLTGHQGYVASVAFSPDGKELVSAGGPDMSVKFWDVATGQMIRSVWGSETDHKNLTSVAFSPDGRLVAVAGWEGLIKFLDIVSGEVVATLKSGAMITSIAFSPDGRLLVEGNESGGTRVVIWDVAKGQALRGVEGIHGDVNAVVFSPDGKTVAAGISDFTISPSADNSIKLWSAADGRLMQTIADNPGHFQKIAFAPDGKTLASTGFQNTAKIWDIASGRLVRGVTDSQNAWGLAYSPDGRVLALGSSEIGLWNAATGAPIRKLEGPRDTYYCIAFSPDGRLVAAGSQDRAIRLWDVSKVATAAR